MITVLSGPNRTELDKKLKILVSEFVQQHSDLSLERFDGEEASFDELVGAVSSLPFLSAKKLVVIRRLAGNKPAAEKIETLLENCHDLVDLIIVEDKIDRRSVYYKTLKALPGFTEFKELDERQLADWVVDQATEKGGKINRADAVLLINRVGVNQQTLSSEIDKLVLYKPEITKQGIELLTDMTPRSSVFNLLDKAFAGDTKEALKLYEEQRQQNVEPYNILALIIWQLNALALASTAGKISSAELASQSGLSPYTASKAQNMANRRSLSEISRIVKKVVELEYKSKTSSVDVDEGLKNFIASL